MHTASPVKRRLGLSLKIIRLTPRSRLRRPSRPEKLASFDASTSSDDDGSMTAYHWDFGDGQSLDTAGPVASHTYARGGQKTVTLTVTDNDGSTGQNQQIVSVIDRPPSASFAAPASVGKGQPARFDASGSADPDGAITTYRWDFGDGQTQSTTNPVTTHTYNQGGRKAVALTVIDDSGNSDFRPTRRHRHCAGSRVPRSRRPRLSRSDTRRYSTHPLPRIPTAR